MTRPTKHPTKHLASLREVHLMAAGRSRGMCIVYMSLARYDIGTRSVWLKAAREAHHDYLREMRAAQEAT